MIPGMHEIAGIELGVLETDPAELDIEGYEQAARYAEVHIVPGDKVIEARVLQFGQGAGRGLFMGAKKGDECLVFFPGNRENSAVAVTGLGSNKAPHPDGIDGSRAVLLHEGGIKLETTTAGAEPAAGDVMVSVPAANLISLVKAATSSPDRLLNRAFMNDASQLFTEIQTLLGGLGLTIPSLVAFTADVVTSNASGGPFATTNVEAD